MKFEELENEYIEGRKFSNGFRYKIAEKEKSVITRIEQIVRITKGKKVIHLGFCDHIPLIEEKIKKGNWLHNELLKSTSKCIGVDIDLDAVEEIKNKYNIQDIYTHDILSEDLLGPIVNDDYDYIILGEILEHIDNPVLFIEKIRKNYGRHFRKMIITVPNALSWNNVKHTFKSEEFINTDHRYWFSPATLAKIAFQAGYTVDSFYFNQYYKGNGPIKSFFYRRYPALRSGLVMVLSL